jgi:dihydrofolate synthase / folylpolyglutamate synthase
MTYAATLEYLFAQLPMFSRTGADAYKKDLTNIRALCDRLGNPQERFRTIHVGGTNGKGSVSHMLAAALQEAGYRTGLYTSPHLYDFRERIRINGLPVTEEFVVHFTERVKPWIAEIEPSFFEITVAMAFEWFAEQEVQIAVIEVGLGGRLDSTNIITPLLSVITNIGWDHTNILGDTLEAIAGEKAGIIKAGVPVVIGKRAAITDGVFLTKANSVTAPICFAEDLFRVNTKHVNARLRVLEADDLETNQTETITLDLPGVYQEQNLATALAAVKMLRKSGIEISRDQCREAWRNVTGKTGLMGRWEVLREQPLVVLDVAHNKDGMAQVHRQLAEMTYSKLHLVFGMVRDKDVAAVLDLVPAADHYYFTQAHIPRALPASELALAAESKGLKGALFNNVNDALQEALAAAAAHDLILVCGSIFLVAEVEKERFSAPTMA